MTQYYNSEMSEQNIERYVTHSLCHKHVPRSTIDYIL